MLAQDLLRHVELFLTGQTTLQEMEAQLLTHLQAIMDSGDPCLMHVADEIDADLVDFEEGLIDYSLLRIKLDNYLHTLRTIFVTFADHAADQRCLRSSVQIATNSETVRKSLDVRPVLDLRLRHAFA